MNLHFFWFLGLLTVLPGLADPQTPPEEDFETVCQPAGQSALEADHFEEARGAFKDGLESAVKAGSKGVETACRFYLGLTAQLEARAQSLPEQRQRLLLEAQKWYEAASPSYGTVEVVGNLARVYSDLGLRDKADRLFSAAIRNTKGDSEVALERSYADLLRDQGRWEVGALHYRRVLTEVPSDEATWDAFLGMLGKDQPDALPSAVWEAVEANQTLTAQRYALSALSSAPISSEKRISLLAAVVAALSRQHYSPKTFPSGEGEVPRGLRQLSTDPTLGVGARLVLEVHKQEESGAESFKWWADKSSPYHYSPLEAFRSLLRALAARIDGGELRTARKYLELADQMAPEVADLPLYINLAANYAAGEDLNALSASLRRWEPAINKSEDQTAPVDLVHFRLAMSDALHALGSKAAADEVVSVQYQLSRAEEAAKRSKDREVLAEVAEARLRIIRQQPKGGGGGGARTIDIATLDCTGGPGGCESFKVEVPDLLPRPEDLRAGLTRCAIVLRGCDRPHTIGWRFVPTSPLGASSADVRFARSSSATESGDPRSEVCSGCQTVEAYQHSILATSERQQVPLAPRPLWVTAGVWGGSSSLLMVDVLRSRLLRYGRDGHLLEAPMGIDTEHEESLSRIRQSPSGLLVLELGAGQVVWLDGEGQPARRVTLVGRRGTQGVLEGVMDWTVTGESKVLAIGNILRRDGSWESGLVRVPVASSGGFEMVSGWAADDPSAILYKIGQPYLAAMDGRGYFLKIEKKLSLYEVSDKEPSPRLITYLPGGLKVAEQQALLNHQTVATLAELYRIVENVDVPAGLYASDGFLFLLKRRTGIHSGEFSWQIEKLDPRQGQILQTVNLPTSAHHLTVIPGATNWALIERGAVEGPGSQEISSVVFVPTLIIEGQRPGGPVVAGSGEGQQVGPPTAGRRWAP